MLKRSAFLALPAVALAMVFAAPAAATPSCDLYASPTGSDSASGTLAAPLRTVQNLSDSLGTGQVGCLRSGTYHGARPFGDAYEQIKVSMPGVTLTSAPGERATVIGRIWIAEGADNVTIENLFLDGENANGAPSPTINASGTTFRHNEVTNNHTSICFLLGSPEWGRARNTLIEANRIHDCGALPRTNYDHGIYLSAASDTTIRGNWIYNNADRGIQLYPDAQNTVIEGNVISGNGVGIIISGNETVAANNTSVRGNVIVNSMERHNIESYYPGSGPLGTNNLVTANCVHGAEGWYGQESGGSAIANPQVGFTAVNNVIAPAQFVNAASGDFRMTGGACAGALIDVLSGATPGLLTDQLGPAPQSSKKSGTVVLRTRRSGRRGTVLWMAGRASSPSVDVTAALIEVRRDGAWKRVGRAAVRRGGSFKATTRLSGSAKQVFIRARVPGVGASKPVRVRVI